MNVIIAELARIAPDYEPTSAQIRAAEKADDPQSVADSLEAEIEAITDLMREKLDLAVPPFKQVIKLVDFERKFVSIDGMSELWLLHKAGVVDAFKIGRESVLDDDQNPTLMILTAMYRDMLGREPDENGLQFWLDARENGKGWDELVPLFISGVQAGDMVT